MAVFLVGAVRWRSGGAVRKSGRGAVCWVWRWWGRRPEVGRLSRLRCATDGQCAGGRQPRGQSGSERAAVARRKSARAVVLVVCRVVRCSARHGGPPFGTEKVRL
jgi:hypothetical protein